MAAGAADNISPRVRLEYYPGYYAADVLDPDGYSIEVVHKGLGQSDAGLKERCRARPPSPASFHSHEVANDWHRCMYVGVLFSFHDWMAAIVRISLSSLRKVKGGFPPSTSATRRRFRLHRALLQSDAPPLDERLSQSYAIRGESDESLSCRPRKRKQLNWPPAEGAKERQMVGALWKEASKGACIFSMPAIRISRTF